MRLRARRLAAALACTVGIACSAGAAGASGETQTTLLGIPCQAQSDGVQACVGDIAHRVHTFDGVPLDVDIYVPPADQKGPFPLIVFHHGYGLNKSASGIDTSLATQGYVVMAYSARGFGDSCGSAVSRLADPQGCEKGYVHLDDARFEARDTQTLAAKLADAGIADPAKIGVTGTSYGGGISMILAALKDRVMMPDGKLVPWRSPDRGFHMQIAAAAPQWGWSDLSYALVPNGNTLDYLTSNPYGSRIGVAKSSYLGLLYTLGLGTGFYAPAYTTSDADLTGWINRIDAGEPYDDAFAQNIVHEIEVHHSAYYLQDGLPASQRGQPAPIFAYNAWTDDLFPADEVLRYRNRTLGEFPKAEFSTLFAAGAGHPRASLTATTPGLAEALSLFLNRHLQGSGGLPSTVTTYTQACNGAPQLGPFKTATWRDQHPGEVRLDDPATRTLSSAGGSQATATAVDPAGGATASNACIVLPAADDPGALTYRLPAAAGDGYTLVGSPTVVARLSATGANAQIATRLWDVAPDGSQAFITRGLYRPPPGDTGRRQVFQLHPNGWHFAAGHVAKLELLGRDSPYGRASNGDFSVSVDGLELRLPVRETAGGQVQAPLPFLRRDGLNFGACTNARNGSGRPDKLVGTSAGDLLFGRAGADRLSGRGGADCLQGGTGPDALRGGGNVDVLIGLGGNDRLLGGPGADRVAGNSGKDSYAEGPGNDRIYSLDGTPETVNCGAGRDTVRADPSDRLRGCEKVQLRKGGKRAHALGRFLGARAARISLR